MQPKHILLTTDLSETAQRAFEPVCELARSTGARITLLHVIFVLTEVPAGAVIGTPIGPTDYETDRRTAVHALEEQARLLDADLDVALRVITGKNVAQTIVKYAREHDVDMIAMASHGRSGMRRMVLGSVAEGILRHANVPVLCFPPAA